MGLPVDQNATSLVTRPEMRFCGHNGHPNVIERFPEVSHEASDHICNCSRCVLTTATTMLSSYSPSTERHAAGTVIGHCKNFHSLAGTKASELMPY